MSYSTGFSIDRDGLVDTIRAFCITNGWTVNQYGAKNTGYLLCMQKATGAGHTVYVSIRSVNNETFPTLIIAGPNNTNNSSGILISMSTGYDASKDVYNQPGAIVRTNNSANYYCGVLYPISAVSTYWMYGYTSPETICIVLQLPDGQYRHLVFGDIYKTTAFTGGQYFFTSNGSMRAEGDVQRTYQGLPFEFEDNTGGPNGSGFIRCDLDGRNGWWDTAASNYTRNPLHLDVEGCVAGTRLLDNLALDNSVNSFSGIGALFPVNLFAHYTQIHKYKPIGYLPWLRVCLKAAYVPDSVQAIGPDHWKVHPSVGPASPYSIAYKFDF